MYHCQDCERKFNEGELTLETHCLATAPFERVYCCTHCGGQNYRKTSKTHCLCCGARLGQGGQEYCNENCRIRGKKMWEGEMKRRRLNFASPLAVITREIEEYNRENKTQYSYGQYVAFIRPGMKMRSKRK